MPVSYFARHLGGGSVSSTIKSLAACLASPRWPAGHHEITEHVHDPGRAGHGGYRWGVAIKHPDGTVALIPDRPAGLPVDDDPPGSEQLGPARLGLHFGSRGLLPGNGRGGPRRPPG